MVKWHSASTIFAFPLGWWGSCACGWESWRSYPVEYLAQGAADRHVDRMKPRRYKR